MEGQLHWMAYSLAVKIEHPGFNMLGSTRCPCVFACVHFMCVCFVLCVDRQAD